MIQAFSQELYGTLQSLKLSKLFQCVLLCTPVRAVEILLSLSKNQRVLLLLSLSISHSLRYDNYSACNSSRPINKRDSLVQLVKYFIYQVVEYAYKDKFNESTATNTTEMAFLMKIFLFRKGILFPRLLYSPYHMGKFKMW